MDDRHNDLVKLYRELAAFFASVVPAKLDRHPGTAEINAVRADLVLLAAQVDRIVEETADYVQQRSGHAIDYTMKSQQLFSAIDGNLLYEIEQAAHEAEGGR
jgi:hypothetical protein